MTPFTTHRGLIATLDRANVDTDQIIPKQFLKSIARTGFGPQLFYDWRYLPDRSPNPDFELNQPRFKGATILVARNNFGCGSSREHAVWAVQQDGYRAVIAPRQSRNGAMIPAFADIFRSNAGKNGLPAVELAEDEVEQIFELVGRFSGLEATVDLRHQRVTLHLPEEVSFGFHIDSGIKHRLIEGLDEIGLTLQHEDSISAFESTHLNLSRPAPSPSQ